MYADYEFYRTEYSGNQISEADFLRNANLSSAYLDRITSGRAKRVEGEERLFLLKMACCAVAEIFFLEASGGDITSESTDGYSYSRSGNSVPLEARKRGAAALFLGDTGLLYRGGGSW